jgi:sentrin-specific protease 1
VRIPLPIQFNTYHNSKFIYYYSSPKPPLPFTPSLEQLQRRSRSRDDAIEKHLRPKRVPLPPSLPPGDEDQVNAILKKRGVISKYAREQVSDSDLVRLRPGSWLNDEIINFYGALLLGRSEGACSSSSKEKENKGIVNGSGKKSKFLNVHYFSTFFWTKLEKEGYEKGRLAKWTKKVCVFLGFPMSSLTIDHFSLTSSQKT